MKLIGIYCIYHIASSKCYVGQSTNIKNRWKYHKYSNSKSYINSAIKKHGYDNFSFQILELCETEILDDREMYWIAALDCIVPNGYNLTCGGEAGKIPNAQTRKKIGLANLGEKNGFYGKSHTLEQRQKWS